MEIDLSLSGLITAKLALIAPKTQMQVDAIIGDVISKRATNGLYGSAYYQDGSDRFYLPIEIVVGKGTIPGTSSTYAEALGVSDGNGNYTGKWWLPNPVMSIDMKPHVIDTELTERNGVVSELINISGYKISITGFLVNLAANEFPEVDFDTLNRLANLQAPFQINNVKSDVAFMDSGNSSKLVTIRNLRFPKRPGVKHVQDYELELFSEMAFNLIDIS